MESYTLKYKAYLHSDSVHEACGVPLLTTDCDKLAIEMGRIVVLRLAVCLDESLCHQVDDVLQASMWRIGD